VSMLGCRQDLHPVSISLVEFSYLVSNVWHVKIMVQSVISNIARCINDNSKEFVLEPL
jgi:hypothetical protein